MKTLYLVLSTFQAISTYAQEQHPVTEEPIKTEAVQSKSNEKITPEEEEYLRLKKEIEKPYKLQKTTVDLNYRKYKNLAESQQDKAKQIKIMLEIKKQEARDSFVSSIYSESGDQTNETKTNGVYNFRSNYDAKTYQVTIGSIKCEKTEISDKEFSKKERIVTIEIECTVYPKYHDAKQAEREKAKADAEKAKADAAIKKAQEDAAAEIAKIKAEADAEKARLKKQDEKSDVDSDTLLFWSTTTNRYASNYQYCDALYKNYEKFPNSTDAKKFLISRMKNGCGMCSLRRISSGQDSYQLKKTTYLEQYTDDYYELIVLEDNGDLSLRPQSEAQNCWRPLESQFKAILEAIKYGYCKP